MSPQDHHGAVLTPPQIKKGRYRHYKGNEYRVIGVAMHSESLEPLVVYEAIIPSPGGASLWVRPYGMFIETIRMDGKDVPRFEYLED